MGLIISIAMVAAAVFFLTESMNVGYHWKTSMHVGALVTLVAAVHYFYIRDASIYLCPRLSFLIHINIIIDQFEDMGSLPKLYQQDSSFRA